MDRHSPHNLEAEQAVLGSILIAPEVREQVAELVRPEDFYDERHRAIFRAMLNLNGTPLDQITVAEQLDKQVELDKVGGPGYLTVLVNECPSYLNAATYAGIVKRTSDQRRLIDAGTQMVEKAWKQDLDGAWEVARSVTDDALRQNSGDSEWQWMTMKEAYQKREPRQYVVAGILPLPSLSIFFGAPGSLKTMLAQDLACCVVKGKPWLEALRGKESQAYETMQAPVLWIDVDNGRDRLSSRFAALGRAHDVPDGSPLHYVCFPEPPFKAARTDSVQRVIDMATNTGAKLIVFDNLGTISGGADENSSQMVAVMGGLRRIAEETSAAVVVIHHKTKGTPTRKGDALRGHSSIEGAVDLALLIEREGHQDSVTMRSTKSRDALVKPFPALWTYESQGTELTRGRFFGTDRPSALKPTKKEQAKQCILRDMKVGDNQSQLVSLVKENIGVGRTTALEAIKELENERRIVRSDDGSSAIYHRSEEKDVF